ncbi:acyl-CoA N-acyltransferase, partial [Blastocladiella britannica]
WGYFPWGPFADVAEYSAHVHRVFYSPHTSLLFTVWSTVEPDGHTPVPNGPRLVGVVGLIATVPDHRRTEVGPVLYASAYRGTFVNKAAVATVLTWTFETLGFLRVEWKCDARNDASFYAAKSLGFVHEGDFRAHMVLPDGFVRTSRYLAIVQSEW